MTLTDSRRRVVEALKRAEASTVADVASTLSLTPAAVRLHLADLERTGLVERRARPASGPGRPGELWALTELADSLFPDRHADLTVELLEAVRRAVGDDGLQRVVDERSKVQVRAYKAVTGGGRLAARVEALARQRTAEGYMAEAIEDEDGSVVLIERHCPICDAARTCQRLCVAELEVFRAALGRTVTVEREQHLLAGDARCAYRMRER